MKPFFSMVTQCLFIFKIDLSNEISKLMKNKTALYFLIDEDLKIPFNILVVVG